MTARIIEIDGFDVYAVECDLCGRRAVSGASREEAIGEAKARGFEDMSLPVVNQTGGTPYRKPATVCDVCQVHGREDTVKGILQFA